MSKPVDINEWISIGALVVSGAVLWTSRKHTRLLQRQIEEQTKRDAEGLSATIAAIRQQLEGIERTLTALGQRTFRLENILIQRAEKRRNRVSPENGEILPK